MTRIEEQIYTELRGKGVAISDIAALYDRAIRSPRRTYHAIDWIAVTTAVEKHFGPGSMRDVRKQRPVR